MFARSALRVAQPLKFSARRYATEGGANAAPGGGGGGGGGGTNLPLLAAVAAASAAGGYYYYNSTSAVGAGLGAAKPTGNKTFQGGDQGWIDLRLEDAQTVNHNVKKLRFALPDKGDVSGLKIASALITKFKAEGDEKPTIRPYTPTSDADAVGYLDLVVKKYPNGPMSTHIHDLKSGDTLSFKGPIPKYPVETNQHDHIALIAGGTGITPMWQVARAIFSNPDDKTKVTLVFGNVTQEDILLKEEWDKLENTYPQRFRAFYVLDNPPEGWKGGKGFITKELLKTVLPEAKEENIKVMVCGPPGLYKAVSGEKKSPKDQGELSGILKDLGYSKDQVFKF